MKLTNAVGPKKDKILMLGKKTKKIKKLKVILTEHSREVFISDAADMKNLFLKNNYNVIIVTDSLGAKLNQEFVSDLKTFWPHAKLLCLVDRITDETEIAVRSGGIIFLGTYDHFSKNYHDILYAAEKTKRLVG